VRRQPGGPTASGEAFPPRKPRYWRSRYRLATCRPVPFEAPSIRSKSTSTFAADARQSGRPTASGERSPRRPLH
jgi:hypothetical protein